MYHSLSFIILVPLIRERYHLTSSTAYGDPPRTAAGHLAVCPSPPAARAALSAILGRSVGGRSATQLWAGAFSDYLTTQRGALVGAATPHAQSADLAGRSVSLSQVSAHTPAPSPILWRCASKSMTDPAIAALRLVSRSSFYEVWRAPEIARVAATLKAAGWDWWT